MPYRDLIDSSRLYHPALLVDAMFPKKTRRIFRDIFGILSAVLFVPVLVGLFFDVILLSPFEYKIQGLFFISFSLWLDLTLLQAFYNSYYFRDITPVLREHGLKGGDVSLTYDVAEIVYRTDPSDITAGFVLSSPGLFVLSRLGLDVPAVEHFLKSRKSLVTESAIMFPASSKIILPVYAKAVFSADKEFSQFLFALGVQEKEYIGASKWMSRLEEKIKHHTRFWGKDGLGKIPGIGKAWAYGQIFTLKKFAEEFESGIIPEEKGIKEDVEKLEAVLARAREANALIVADSGSGEMDIIFGLVGKIQNGTILPMLEDKRVFRLDGNALIDASETKTKFENQFIKVMNEAVSAGNVILVFEDLPGFIKSGVGVGSDIPGLLYPYLNSSKIQIVAIADKTRFHQSLETNTALMNAFEIIRLEEKDESSIVAILEDEVISIEGRTELFFTYQAVETIAESAARFFTEGIAVDKAKDLLLEIPPVMKRAKRTVVTKADVLSMVETKTGVPQEGIVKGEEKDKLLNLEKILHQRVVGQDEAVSSIANAMRRARAGLRNPNRPIGSFLFLGPTGVGKTETAKALAEVFFGSSAPILRLDMSEYSGDDALVRLTGSFEGGRAGVLSSMLRDQKYGVLLLDEFEKTNSDVMDLFLQILDEGFFSDMVGKKVNAQNIIVIATSNAGSDMIFKLVGEGKDLANEKDTLIDHLVKSGEFKPELLNRFDGVVLFHPLAEDHLKKIAGLMVEKLSLRLKDQGINLKVTEDLLRFLSKEGFDQKFGARPMNRILQEQVEKLLADKIIRGEIQKGSTVEFATPPGNLSSLEVRAVSD